MGVILAKLCGLANSEVLSTISLSYVFSFVEVFLRLSLYMSYINSENSTTCASMGHQKALNALDSRNGVVPRNLK